MANSLLNLFSLNGLLAFLAGILATLTWHWLIDRYHDKREPELRPHRTKFKSLLLLWMLVYFVVAYIALQEQIASNKINRLISCNAQFLETSKQRQEAGDQTDEWSRIKTKAMADWMHALLQPPPDMAARRQVNNGDPVYVRWALDVTDKYYSIIDQAEQEQEKSINYRKDHPLPNVSSSECGR